MKKYRVVVGEPIGHLGDTAYGGTGTHVRGVLGPLEFDTLVEAQRAARDCAAKNSK